MRAALPRTERRRGVTLVEMLVVVALVVLMMVILVQIFQSATGAMSASRAVQELDVTLRQVDLRLRADLGGVTARMTPPLDPTLKLGYFEYGENALADAQGEDTDDYLAFTTKAPEGQVFTGRVFIPNNIPGKLGVAANLAVQPVTVTSQLAEVIYFLRNGNLYRRVFLIVPERNGSIGTATANIFPGLGPVARVGFLGVNDISMHPIKTGLLTGSSPVTSVPNDLGDLTNRENRAFRPRFRNDFYINNNFPAGPASPNQDGKPDDFNADDIDDFYPTLYPNLFNHYPTGVGNPGLINEDPTNFNNFGNPRSIASLDVHPFPYIYPGMFSQPESASLGTGWVHSLDPSGATFNHYPLPSNDPLSPNRPNANQRQTWWGFPTWRETLSSNWFDPAVGLVLNTTPVQRNGLRPFPPGKTPAATISGDNTYALNLLPPVTVQYGNDGVGSIGGSSFQTFTNAPGVWDDDLILTNVRSFDVKAYDQDAPLYINMAATPPFLPSAGYYDLGAGIVGNPGLLLNTPKTLWGSDNQPQGFLHAGRIPPLGGAADTFPGGDNRVNPSRPYNPFNTVDALNYVGDSGAGVVRLTRVWDTWSTDYTNAPAVDINLNGHPGSIQSANSIFPQPMPVYPSYPPPYPTPLRGIQIQIRVADPRGERIKVLTIRQDFTDKL